MKFIKNNSLISVIVILLITVQSIGCSQDKQKRTGEKTPDDKKKVVEITSPRHGEVFKCGDSVRIKLDVKKKEKIDSVVLSSAGSQNVIYKTNFSDLVFPSGNKAGQKIIKAEIFFSDNQIEKRSVVVVLLSDIIPVNHKYTVIGKYPHDANAYTQGLIFSDGILFESTGQQNHSSIRKVNIKTGSIIKKVDLKPELFGEGIALVDDKIYQITYLNKIGFIYEKETLELVRSFEYAINEGWGLTSKNDTLFLTDGSSFLYTIEPEYFSQIDQIEIFNHKGRIDSINELEYINGKIFANVYGRSVIIIIDPLTGKVTGEIDLKNLVPKELPADLDHVLNGIAYNPSNNHLYITGKLWPVLYEIKLDNYF